MRTQRAIRKDATLSLSSIAFRVAQVRAAEAGREHALMAALHLASSRASATLLARIFARWVRMCSLRPARTLAQRSLADLETLRADLAEAEIVGVHASAVAEAAELHVLSLRQQRGSTEAWGESERVSERARSEQLRLRLAESQVSYISPVTSCFSHVCYPVLRVDAHVHGGVRTRCRVRAPPPPPRPLRSVPLASRAGCP